MKETCNKACKLSFSFSQVRNKDSLAEAQGLDIKNQLDIKKAAQESDICIRIIKENTGIFGYIILSKRNK